MPDPADAGELAQLRRALDEARATADGYLDLVQRTQAELVNYRRRVEGERRADVDRARAAAVDEMLPLLDDLDRAVAHLPGELREHAWAKGVALLAGRIDATLARLGVERVGRAGEPFDPNRHEAVAAEPRRGVEPGQVAEVVRPGYRVGERLVRPAQVVVGAEGAPPAAEREGGAGPPERGPGELLDERV